MDEGVELVAGGAVDVGGERRDGTGVGEIGGEGRGLMPAGDEGIGTLARLLDVVRHDQEAGAAPREGLGDGLTHLAGTAHSREQHVAPVEFHAHLSGVNDRCRSHEGVDRVARSM
jgi:hypothetical protein